METFLMGVVVGLLVGPVFRSWMAWREYEAASRQARLADETLRWLEEQDRPPREAA